MGTACLIAANASWALEDSVTALIRTQTDAFSKASDLQDQEAMDRLLDPDVLFSGGSGEVDRDPERDKTDPVSALLERQTQEFRNAGQRGDVATMRRYLDPKVLFVDEDGVVSGRQDFRLGAPAPPPGSVSSQVTVKEWVVHHGDDAAVSSFIDDQQVDYGGYSVDYRFLSVETWIKRANAWRLLGSETIPLHENPVPAAVSAQALDEYAGQYSDGAALTITISRDGDALAASVNGDKANTLVAEARDFFFRPDSHPGYGRRRVMFRRDASGRVTEYVSGELVLARTPSSAASGAPIGEPAAVASSLTLRDFVVHRAGNVVVASFLHDRVANYHGHALHATYRSIETWIKHDQAWTMLASQGRELQGVPPAATLPAQKSNDYVGAFRLGRAFTVKISSVGGMLFASTKGLKGVALTPVAEDIFIVAATPRTSFMFHRNASGSVTGVVERRDERDLTLLRVWTPGESLLNADRALAARSQQVGFVAAYAEAMAPDAHKFDAGVPTAVGRSAILALMARYPNDLHIDWNPEEEVVSGAGDLGYTWGHYLATSHDHMGANVVERGRYLDVWRRQSDGQWRWIADIGTSDPPDVVAATQAQSPAVAQDDMVLIPAGSFDMGSSEAETSRNHVPQEFAEHEHPSHKVNISAFLLATHDVTRGEFAEFVSATAYSSSGCHVWDGYQWLDLAAASWRNPGFDQTARDPVVCVNRADIQAYITWRSKMTGRAYRLPTEAEWEYAARAGTTTSRYWGDDAAKQCAFANGAAESYSRRFPQEPDVNRACSDGYVFTSPVGSFAPNPWGLFDMLGDVWQWTADCGNASFDGAPSDGSAWSSGDCVHHVYRGGSWFDGPWLIRSATRNFGDVDRRFNGTGFRLAAPS
jgi:formylglycine-generating enzyme required for sulfatase activity